MKLAIALTAFALASTSAMADRMPVPSNAPPAFKAECGGCHFVFPPALLAAPDWRRVMSGLDKHYGDNAGLDEKTRQQIENFLVRNAGSGHRTVGAGDPPRLTMTGWFRKEHDKVPAAAWKDKGVGSAANCAACHTQAEQGSFRGREIRMPGGYRHERD